MQKTMQKTFQSLRRRRTKARLGAAALGARRGAGRRGGGLRQRPESQAALEGGPATHRGTGVPHGI